MLNKKISIILSTFLLIFLFSSCEQAKSIEHKDSVILENNEYIENSFDVSCKYIDLDEIEERIKRIEMYFYPQIDEDSTGIASLAMLLHHHTQSVIDLEELSEEIGLDDSGDTINTMKISAIASGLKASIFECSIENLIAIVSKGSPVIARISNETETKADFIVVSGYNLNEEKLYIENPSGLTNDEISFDEFKKHWNINFLEAKDDSHNNMLLIKK